MAYVIAEPWIDVKDNSCVEACLVGAEDQLPDEWWRFIKTNADYRAAER
jgi:hypothetical protein